MATESLTKIIVSHDTSDYAYYSATDLDNGHNGSDNTSSYAQINLTRGANAITYIYWNFPAFSEIPEGATIDSVDCTFTCTINTTTSSRVATRQGRLYSGTSAMGSTKTISTSTSPMSITAGTWTRAQLQNPRLRLYGVRGTSNTSTNYYFRFYGATMTVTYTYQDVAFKIRVKQSGTWKEATKGFVKQNGSWVSIKKVFVKQNGTWEQSQ